MRAPICGAYYARDGEWLWAVARRLVLAQVAKRRPDDDSAAPRSPVDDAARRVPMRLVPADAEFDG